MAQIQTEELPEKEFSKPNENFAVKRKASDKIPEHAFRIKEEKSESKANQLSLKLKSAKSF